MMYTKEAELNIAIKYQEKTNRCSRHQENSLVRLGIYTRTSNSCNTSSSDGLLVCIKLLEG